MTDTPGVKPELMDEVGAVAAQQKAMARGCKSLPHGCRLFEVEQGWESTMINRDKTVVVADTLLSLESALRDPESKVVFIPADALMTDKDIEKLCQRNGVIKTLFREVKKV